MRKKSGRKWMQRLNIREGALTRKAKKAHMSTSRFAKKHAHDTGRTGKQARLAETFARFRPKRSTKRSK